MSNIYYQFIKYSFVVNMNRAQNISKYYDKNVYTTHLTIARLS